MTRTIYHFDKGKMVQKVTVKNRKRSAAIHSDLPGYLSPLGTGWIEGRTARREDLRRGGCVEVGHLDFK